MSLRRQIDDVIADAPGTFGIYARHLETSEIVEVNADRVMNAESAAKVFILIYYRQLVASGACDPTRRIELTDEDGYWGTGVLRYLASGLQPTLDDLAWLMIIVSDNAATAMLLQAIGDQGTVNAAMSELGLESGKLNPSITVETAMAGEAFATATPRDLAEAFTLLDDEAKAILFRQQNLLSLPRRLPHAADAADLGFEMPVRVCSKTGNDVGTCVDAGLFETPGGSWVAAAMAADQLDFASRADDMAPTAFARVGEALYNAWGPQAPHRRSK
jgi:beta-lactamase class A